MRRDWDDIGLIAVAEEIGTHHVLSWEPGLGLRR
jgi:hypothetical protein